MSTHSQTSFAARPQLRHDFAEKLPDMVREARGEDNPELRLVVLNEPLARELGFDPDWLRSPAGLDFLAARGDEPAHAQAYAGFQFGQYNPRMGDGRAALLGEVETPDGLRDLHAKGIGRTAFSRPGSDGRGTLRSMLREYLFSEALHALGVPTTRGLAVLSTGRKIQRQMVEPAGIHVRVAASHLRVGSFHYAAQTGQLEALADYAIERHYPGADYRQLYSRAMDAQVTTVAAWQRLGFIHGVMNTDNTTLSGETIDFGPCAFMETYSPDTWFSSIDTQGRYRFGNQPTILGWNFARLGETLLPLFDENPDNAVSFAQETINTFHDRFAAARAADAAAHLRLSTAAAPGVISAYDAALAQHAPDLTLANRALAKRDAEALALLLPGFEVPQSPGTRAPRVIPRARNVEAALTDLAEYARFLHAVTHPYDESPGYEEPGDLEGYLTYCGT